MSKTNGGPAFPSQPVQLIGDAEITVEQGGMTLRDYFAAEAAMGISGYLTNIDDDELAEETAKLARAAYAIADAMLAERAKDGAA